MAINTLHRLDKIVFAGPSTLNEISSSRISAGIESMLEHPAGHVWPMFRANMRQRPTIEGSTPQLATFLALCNAGGVALGASTFYLKKATTTGSVARATTGHKRIVVNSLVLHWTQIRLPHNGKGEAQFIVTANYDGTNAPFVYTGSIALTGNLTATEYFGAGPVYINDVLVPGVQDITIDSGIQLVQEGGESDVWDTFVGIETGAPTITIQTKEETNWSTLGLAGVALDGSDGVLCFARKYAANGARVANATTEHISFQGLLGSAIPQDTNGEGTSTISDTLKCELVASSDSVLPLLTSVGVAIP